MGKIVGLVFGTEKNKSGGEPTIKDIKALLDEKGIVYDGKAKKPELLKLLEESQANAGVGN